jgi:hypothetical protein
MTSRRQTADNARNKSQTYTNCRRQGKYIFFDSIVKSILALQASAVGNRGSRRARNYPYLNYDAKRNGQRLLTFDNEVLFCQSVTSPADDYKQQTH